MSDQRARSKQINHVILFIVSFYVIETSIFLVYAHKTIEYYRSLGIKPCCSLIHFIELAFLGDYVSFISVIYAMIQKNLEASLFYIVLRIYIMLSGMVITMFQKYGYINMASLLVMVVESCYIFYKLRCLSSTNIFFKLNDRIGANSMLKTAYKVS
ncbi:hypothetical protein H311_00686 [Anncaliia algerae PRA109]|nr:hypothetical protein H311_00686 [Anncaliia algerae PRA109]